MKPKVVNLNFATLELYDRYVIATIHEGVVFQQSNLDEIFNKFKGYFSGKPFVTIANRKYDYTVDPTMLKLIEFPNLIAIGVVCYSRSSYEIALFEKEFYPGAFEVFMEMEDCISWTLSLLEKK